VKSAYEIAMERLEKESGPAQKLTEAQREQIADIDKRFDALIAEERMKLDGLLSQAVSAEEVERFRSDMVKAISSLDERREKEKAAVWGAE
jgi:hypothetical protein